MRCWCGHRAFSPASGAVAVLRIAIGWMMCQDGHPAPPPPSCLPRKKFGCRPLAGSGGLPRAADTLPVASGPPPAVTITSIQSGQARPSTSYQTCGSDAPRRPVADRRATGEARVPGRSSCCRRGDGIRIFSQARWWPHGTEVRPCTASTRSRSVKAGAGWTAVHRIGRHNTRAGTL
jgi:hypothetical protein